MVVVGLPTSVPTPNSSSVLLISKQQKVLAEKVTALRLGLLAALSLCMAH